MNAQLVLATYSDTREPCIVRRYQGSPEGYASTEGAHTVCPRGACFSRQSVQAAKCPRCPRGARRADDMTESRLPFPSAVRVSPECVREPGATRVSAFLRTALSRGRQRESGHRRRMGFRTTLPCRTPNRVRPLPHPSQELRLPPVRPADRDTGRGARSSDTSPFQIAGSTRRG